MNEKRILLICPLMDIPTVTSNLAVNDLIDYAQTHSNIDLDYLFGPAATRTFFNLYTWRNDYDAVFYYGHGEKDRLLGTNVFRSVINKRNIGKIKNAPLSTMACWSASELGPHAIKEGVKAYIGSIEPYYGAFPEKRRNFLSDWVRYTTSKEKALMDGKTFGDALQIFKDIAYNYADIYKKNIGKGNYDWYHDTILKNIKNMVVLGDPSTRI